MNAEKAPCGWCWRKKKKGDNIFKDRKENLAMVGKK